MVEVVVWFGRVVVFLAGPLSATTATDPSSRRPQPASRTKKSSAVRRAPPTDKPYLNRLSRPAPSASGKCPCPRACETLKHSSGKSTSDLWTVVCAYFFLCCLRHDQTSGGGDAAKRHADHGGPSKQPLAESRRVSRDPARNSGLARPRQPNCSLEGRRVGSGWSYPQWAETRTTVPLGSGRKPNLDQDTSLPRSLCIAARKNNEVLPRVHSTNCLVIHASRMVGKPLRNPNSPYR